MNVFIIGAAGKVGSRLVPLLAEAGHVPLAMHRKSEQAQILADKGGKPVAGDITALSVDELAERMEGADAVVFSAGAGGASYELTQAVDGDGLVKAVAAARKAGATRFLLVSAFPEAGRDAEPKEGFENYMRIKKLTDAHLSQSDLDWVIVRPGTLSSEGGDGRIALGLALPYGNVSRDHVAQVLAGILERPQLSRTILELTDGDTPVGDALDAMV
ncbi:MULTISPECIES: NAD(P)H-binding protein [Novosphingobium]|uniref:NAD(P)H-binding protein n=1 Tax=Novosphingobium mangrovi (ex Hu et al. 2023) TaxID=2930094 RepID=A0ABT0AFQ6_9SPHN|nr:MULTISPECIES: NAD(P)H-binding protein [Novosphingobium]MCJ1962038.1 NAD(P)H-binding protein [Novosphingobium mangrovi (ex Hu et al. 2023)]